MPGKKPAKASPTRAERALAFAKREVTPLASWLSLGTLATLMGGWLFVDDRFAHAAGTDQRFAVVAAARQVDNLSTEIGQYEIRLQLAKQDLSALSFAPVQRPSTGRGFVERLIRHPRRNGISKTWQVRPAGNLRSR